MSEYAKRDHMQLDREGGHYSRHVSAMTAEGLHAKSDIAGELAFRDWKIAALLDRLDNLEGQLRDKTYLLDEAKAAARTWENEAERRSRRYEECAIKLDAAERENERLLKAIHEKGGTEHAPTQWAYDQACAALNRAKEENKALREALLPFVDEGIELNCDECGGDQNKCNASCVVRKGRAVLDAAEREREQFQKWKHDHLELEKTQRLQIDCAHDEVMRLREWEACAREWLAKTEWVQTKDLLPKYLGWHRADIMRDEIERLRGDAERYRWLTDDHPAHETRMLVDAIASRMSVKGKGHIDAAIDAAIAAERGKE